MPNDPRDALEALWTPNAATWQPVELYRLRAQLIDEHTGPDLAAAVARVDQLLALHA